MANALSNDYIVAVKTICDKCLQKEYIFAHSII